jgi:hypothetical protein
MDQGSTRRLNNLCAIFKIRPSATEPNPDLALALLSHLYAMPVIPNKSDRRNYGNQILGNTRGVFDPYSEFVGGLGSNVIMMQEFPHWFANLGRSTEQLVEIYADLERTVYWLNKAGWGAGAAAVGAGIAQTIEKGSVKEGAKRAIDRLAGRSAIIEALQKRFGARLGAAAGVAGVVVIVGGTIAYHSALQQMEEIRNILIDRFHNGQMTDEQFRRVFGDQVDPTLVKKYWEM